MASTRSAIATLWEHTERWAALIALPLALLALWLTYQQVVLSNRLAWDYDGGAQCSDYRSEVLALWEQDLDAEQVRAWFSHEAGGARNEYGATSGNQWAIDDFENNCGSVETLLSHLPPRPAGDT